MFGLLFLCVAATIPLCAQPTEPILSTSATIKPEQEKAMEKVFLPLKEILPQTSTTAELRMEKSPFGAVWRSLLMPGWGQVYVESYWKAPLAFGGAVLLGYQVYSANSKFATYRQQYDNLNDSAQHSSSGQLTLRYREFYRDVRDTYAVYLLGVYLLAAVDAFVGAHLYEFDVTDDLKASLNIMPVQGRIGLALRW